MHTVAQQAFSNWTAAMCADPSLFRADRGFGTGDWPKVTQGWTDGSWESCSPGESRGLVGPTPGSYAVSQRQALSGEPCFGRRQLLLGGRVVVRRTRVLSGR